jgi:hypothetical protein
VYILEPIRRIDLAALRLRGKKALEERRRGDDDHGVQPGPGAGRSAAPASEAFGGM